MKEFTQGEILLVEDNPLDAELTMSGIKGEIGENRLTWVSDGEQALDYLFCRGRFADRDCTAPLLVLLDLKMPKMNGIEVLRHIKSDERTRRIPVVVMTSSNEDADVEQAYELGANSYVVKPLDFNMLTGVMQSAGHYWLTVNRRMAT